MKFIQACAICLLILLVPLPFGGSLDWSKSLFIIITALLVLLELIARLFSNERLLQWEKSGIALWLVITTYIFLQIIPIPFLPESIWCAVCDQKMIDSGLLQPRISPYPLNTLQYWAMFTAYWAIFLIVTKLPTRFCYFLIFSIVVLGLFQAIYGLIAFNKGQETIIGVWKKERFLTSVTGTFYNKNHLAILLALCLPIGASYILSLRQKSAPNKHATKVSFDLYSTLVALYILFLGLAVLGSDSRLGVLLALASMLIYVYSRNKTANRTMSVKEKGFVFAGVLFVVLAGVWIGIGSTVERFLGSTEHIVNRTEIYQSIFDLPASVWVFGIGAAGFEDVYKTVQPYTQYFTAYHAHSDPLQFILEFGVVGTMLVGWFFIRFLQSSAASLPKTDIECAVFAGMIAVLLHSIVDFDFQVPGVALVFWVCFGLLLNPNISSESANRI